MSALVASGCWDNYGEQCLAIILHLQRNRGFLPLSSILMLDDVGESYLLGNECHIKGLIKPRRACAARVVLSFCRSVFLSARVLALHATRRPMSGTNGLWTARRWIYCGDLLETTAFQRYGVKTSEKAYASIHSARAYVAVAIHAHLRDATWLF